MYSHSYLNELSIFSPDLAKFYNIVKEQAPKTFEIWLSMGTFEWGPRPAALVGKTSMKAIWKETDSYYYYGETSPRGNRHGKGITFFKEEK